MQAVDGTKVGANASGSRRTYTGEQLHQLLARVEKSIADLEAQNRYAWAKTAIQFIFQRSCPTARRCGIGSRLSNGGT